MAANGKYPVYIVAAQGGGIYAAAQTLLFLVRMQGLCERFSQHLFAISGVSGGSVGAALYSALARDFESKKTECPLPLPGPVLPSPSMANAVDMAYFLATKDYLSPLLAGFLFPDFAQRFLPFPIPAWSRARALEQALEAAWESEAHLLAPDMRAKGNPMKVGLASSWRPDGMRPALLLNTTETGSGRRRVIAPFKFGERDNNDLRFLPIAVEYDVPLSAAAVASARFPWITPAAWFREKGDVRRIVDGAYFENSGVATAMDLIERLEKIVDAHNLDVEFHLVAMTAAGFPPEDRFRGLGELISPIMSLLNARRAHDNTAIDLAGRKLGTISDTKSSDAKSPAAQRLQKIELKDMLTPLPLGWQLSRASAFQILMQVGLERHCLPNAAFEQSGQPRVVGSTGDCAKLLIDHQLRGDDLQAAAEAARKRF